MYEEDGITAIQKQLKTLPKPNYILLVYLWWVLVWLWVKLGHKHGFCQSDNEFPGHSGIGILSLNFDKTQVKLFLNFTSILCDYPLMWQVKGFTVQNIAMPVLQSRIWNYILKLKFLIRIRNYLHRSFIDNTTHIADSNTWLRVNYFHTLQYWSFTIIIAWLIFIPYFTGYFH